MNPPALLHDVLDVRAAATPDAVAVSRGGRSVSYGRLRQASERVAGWLAGRGVRRNDRVVIRAPAQVWVPALVYGCARAGAVYVLVYERLPAPVLRHVLTDAEPRLLVTDDAASARQAGDLGVAVATPDEVRAACEATGAQAAPDTAPLPVDPVSLTYTSGSTGLPKAVVSTHGQVVFAATAIQSQLAYQPDDVVYCPLPLSFDYGLYQIFLSTLAGCRLHLGSSVEAGPQLLGHLHGCAATVLPAVPLLAEGLARMLSRPGSRPPALRLLTNTGATMPDQVLAELRARIPGLRVQLMFGLTECKRATIMPPDADLHRPGSCGRALPGTEVFAIDADGRRLPPAEVGELVVRGPNVMAGYWRRPDLTAARFPRVEGLFPQLRTGDYGSVDQDGYVYYVGRRDDLYKERGLRVSATEVETAAARVPGVRAAAVLVPGADRPRAVLVAVSSLAPHEILSGLLAELDDFKIPRHCVVTDRLPVTANGKIDRQALAASIEGASRV
ncbi:MAG TPA: class I adenylate-forming enzyme family protein [Micromonosporaceae bacterium]|nr:class I adenylate-forming enzyme family protein [Micromonosporaceae bacterium]